MELNEPKKLYNEPMHIGDSLLYTINIPFISNTHLLCVRVK
jgi:hypothetical protein